MATTNLTVRLDSDLLRRAQAIAAKRGTSVAAMVALELEQLVARDVSYEEAMHRAGDLTRAPIDHGARMWRRDELHDR